MKALTEADILWFSKRTKVFSHEVYQRNSSDKSQQEHVENSAQKMNAVLPIDKQDIDEVAFNDKIVNNETAEEIVCTVCLEKVKDGIQVIILTCRHVLHSGCAE